MPSSNDPRPPRRGQQGPPRQQQAVRRQQPQQQAVQQQAAQDPWRMLTDDLERNRDIYADLLGGKSAAPKPEVDRFLVVCYQTVWHNPKLLDVLRDSLLLAFAEAAAVRLDLNPTAKECYVEIRNGMARFATQYQGLVKLIHRGTKIDWIHADVVRGGDLFRQIGGSDPRIIHESCELGTEPENYDSDDNVLAAYASVLVHGSTRPQFEVARRSDLMKAMAMSKGKAWQAWFARMARKLPLRRLANTLPGADEARRVLAIEDAQPDNGRVVTLERVAELFDDKISSLEKALDDSGSSGGGFAPALPKKPDELMQLMSASGPASGEQPQPQFEPAEPIDV